jgi:hypothetical protein
MSGNSTQIREKLFPAEVRDIYKDEDKYQDHLLEQYKMYHESAEKISSKRQTANSFFVTINTAIIALVSYLHLGSSTSNNYYWIVALAGVAITYMWYRLIRSYRDLNSAKFKVIHEIEKKLPLSPFDAEWEAVGRGKNSALYLPFTYIEVGIPWVFLVLHIVAFCQSFPWEILKLR